MSRKHGKSALAALLASCAAAALAFPLPARANAELDRKYALETVGLLRAWDNMDGLFGDYVAAAYKDYFSRQSRFVLQDLSKTDAILTQSKIPYNRVIEDTEVLGQLARTTKSQSVIRTKIQKEGPQYRFTISWMHSPGMELLAYDEVVIREREDGAGFGLDDIKGSLQATLDRMIRKVPFHGMVTGRDNTSVTLNIGKGSNLLPGDTLVIGTLDEVKKHPLLKEIVDWRLTTTGKLKVDQVEDGIAFAKVEEEEAGREISRFQKVIQIIPANAKANEIPVIEEKPEPADRAAPPTLGWASATGWLGGFSRQFSDNGTMAKSGGAIFMGAAADGQLWLTREWFAELGFAYGFGSYAQDDFSAGVESASGISVSAFAWKLAGGYTYLVTGDFSGPKAWTKFGLHSTSFSLPTVLTEALAPVSFTSPFIGVGGELPIRGKYGAIVNLEFGLFPGGGETGQPNGSTDGASDVRFSLAGYYRWSPRTTFRVGVDILANSAEFSSNSSLSQKIVTVAPSLVYYF